jgi:hypothetical protein
MKSSIKKIIYVVLFIRNILSFGGKWAYGKIKSKKETIIFILLVLQYITKGRNISLIQFNLIIQIVVLQINHLIFLINLIFLIYLLIKEIEGKPSLIRSLSLSFLLFLTIVHNF